MALCFVTEASLKGKTKTVISAVEDLAKDLHINLSGTVVCETNVLCVTFLDEYILERKNDNRYKTYHDMITDAVAVFIASSVTVNVLRYMKEEIIEKLNALHDSDSFISMIVSRIRLSLFPDIHDTKEVIEKILDNLFFCPKTKHAFITDVLIEMCATKIH